MKEGLVPITIEMLKPKPEDRSERANRQLLLLMRHITGHDGLRFHCGIGKGEELSDYDNKAMKVNAYTLEAIRSSYGLPKQVDPHQFYIQQFYLQQQKQAIGVVRYFSETLPEVA